MFQWLPTPDRSWNQRILPCVVAAFFTTMGFAQDPSQKLPVAQVDETVRGLLVTHCRECHSGAKPKGDFRVDELKADFDEPASRDRWAMVLKRLQAGEMPPKAKPRPPQKSVSALTDWVTGQLAAASARRSAEGRVVLRRLNRVEYENTVRDLLGVEIDLQG